MEGLKWVPCENYTQIEKLMEQGSKIRMTASTNMNASSSRSHMVITIQLKQVGSSSVGQDPSDRVGVVPKNLFKVGQWAKVTASSHRGSRTGRAEGLAPPAHPQPSSSFLMAESSYCQPILGVPTGHGWLFSSTKFYTLRNEFEAKLIKESLVKTVTVV